MKKIRILSLLAAITVASGCFSGCSTDKKEEGIHVSVNLAPTDPNSDARKAFDQVINDFMAEHPGITVTGEAWEYAVDSFLPRASGGQLTTAYSTWFSEFSKLVSAGYAADITDIAKKNGIYDQIADNIKEQLEIDGKLYGIPYDSYAMGMVYNAELFEKAGLVDESGLPIIPKTYDEVTETARIIKEKTGQAGFAIPTISGHGGWHIMNIAWSNGVDFMEQIDGKWTVTYDCPEFVDTLQWYADLKWKHDAIPDNNLIQFQKLSEMLASGQLAMVFYASPVTNSESFGTPKEKIGMARLPAGKVARCAQLGGNIWMFNPDATEEEINAVIEYLRYRGTIPTDDDALLEKAKISWAGSAKTSYEDNMLVGFKGMPVWKNVPKYDAAYDEAFAPYKNLNEKLFEDYMSFEDVTIRPEEPVYCQELYKELDAVIQEVLTNKDADIAKLVADSAASFQKNYLDNYTN